MFRTIATVIAIRFVISRLIRERFRSEFLCSNFSHQNNSQRCNCFVRYRKMTTSNQIEIVDWIFLLLLFFFANCKFTMRLVRDLVETILKNKVLKFFKILSLSFPSYRWHDWWWWWRILWNSTKKFFFFPSHSIQSHSNHWPSLNAR